MSGLAETHLDQTGVEEDTGRESVEDTRGTGHSSSVSIERLPDSKTDGDTERAVGNGQQVSRAFMTTRRRHYDSRHDRVQEGSGVGSESKPVG